MKRRYVTVTLTEDQATFLKLLLTTHTRVVELDTGRRCRAILKKLEAAQSPRGRNEK